MSDIQPTTRAETTTGDAAIDGLLVGFGAGGVMIGYLIIAGLAAGEGLAVMLARFDPGGAANPVTGLISHLAVAGVYGALYGVARRPAQRLKSFARLPGWLTGSAFGAALFVVAAILLPGTDSPLNAIPVGHFAVAHLAYGLTLGALVGRPRRV